MPFGSVSQLIKIIALKKVQRILNNFTFHAKKCHWTEEFLQYETLK